ncbi:MAG: hypothetical protein IT306_15860 [Chloroflexi bacterium]|nr:hypothetical protein [Chloroflexota bacterium]
MPADWLSGAAVAADGCTTDGGVRASTCRLADGQSVEATLDAANPSRVFRVDVLAADTSASFELSATGGSTKISVTDWRGEVLASGLRADSAPSIVLNVTLPQPGAYGVLVAGDAPPDTPTFRVKASLATLPVAMRPVWPPLLGQPDGLLTGERQQIKTPRGGTSAAGVAVARALGSPPDGIVADFTLVSDVRFEHIVGPSALTVRFRFEPEAGGGTGYVLSLDPFGGVVSLDSFEEGQRRAVVAHKPLPIMPSSERPNRLVVQATGPSIAATLDGQPILDATDDRFPRGLIAVGVVTWSDPVAVTFDHLMVVTTADR